MIGLPVGTRVRIAAGVTEMRCGFPVLEENPLGGDVFIFRALTRSTDCRARRCKVFLLTGRHKPLRHVI